MSPEIYEVVLEHGFIKCGRSIRRRSIAFNKRTPHLPEKFAGDGDVSCDAGHIVEDVSAAVGINLDEGLIFGVVEGTVAVHRGDSFCSGSSGVSLFLVCEKC